MMYSSGYLKRSMTHLAMPSSIDTKRKMQRESIPHFPLKKIASEDFSQRVSHSDTLQKFCTATPKLYGQMKLSPCRTGGCLKYALIMVSTSATRTIPARFRLTPPG